MKPSKQFIRTALFKGLTDAHATGLCGDVLLDKMCHWIRPGYPLLGKVVQTN